MNNALKLVFLFAAATLVAAEMCKHECTEVTKMKMEYDGDEYDILESMGDQSAMCQSVECGVGEVIFIDS